MTIEQLEEKIVDMDKTIVKLEVGQDTIMEKVTSLDANMEVIQNLAEDVHIMAINMTNMQDTLNKTVAKVEAVEMADYNRYKETKNKVKGTIITGVVSAILTGVIGLVSGLAIAYFKGGF